MQRFAQLYDALDATTSTNAKVRAMRDYFARAPPADAAWGLFFLRGARLKRLLATQPLHDWTLELTGLPEWLVGECYSTAGDFAEAIALLVDGVGPKESAPPQPLSVWAERLQKLPSLATEAQREAVQGWWRQLPRRELYLLLKLLTGELRVGVSDLLVVRAVAQMADLPPATIAHRLMGSWQPSAEFFEHLVSGERPEQDASRPYPFFLASPLDRPLEALGDPRGWLTEWKWDGIRGQLLHRADQIFLWSRGEELITDRFPEVRDAARALPGGTVLDGEVLAFRGGAPLRFSVLQRRIGRQKLSPQILADAPAAFMAFDVLEEGGRDLRALPLAERRARLMALLASAPEVLQVSPALEGKSWPELEQLRRASREHNVEGFVLKRLDSAYGTGRKRGDWWKYKVDPYSVDAVLLYAQPGHGRRATLLTDYTFAVWDRGELLPFAKAYSGLSDAEIAELDKWIRQHTLERYGPVRAVEPSQVFELHFEAIAPSSRHKSGIAVRFPRIARWRTDKKAPDADSLDQVKGLLDVTAG